MGLIDFLKNAGEKIFGGESDEEKRDKLVQHVKNLGLPIQGLRVGVDDETVTVKGTVSSREASEKIALALGNVEGVSKVNNQLEIEEEKKPDAPAKPKAQYHMVQKGDTLSKISKEVYGDPMKYPVIFEANKPMLKDPDLIYPGQVLRIPAKETIA
ncbi:MAG: peptidoglycan-binding protein LysM [Cyclobacteriaceae bacterium]